MLMLMLGVVRVLQGTVDGDFRDGVGEAESNSGGGDTHGVVGEGHFGQGEKWHGKDWGLFHSST